MRSKYGVAAKSSDCLTSATKLSVNPALPKIPSFLPRTILAVRDDKPAPVGSAFWAGVDNCFTGLAPC